MSYTALVPFRRPDSLFDVQLIHQLIQLFNVDSRPKCRTVRTYPKGFQFTNGRPRKAKCQSQRFIQNLLKTFLAAFRSTFKFPGNVIVDGDGCSHIHIIVLKLFAVKMLIRFAFLGIDDVSL